MQEELKSLQHRMAEQLRLMRKMHDPLGHCHCFTCYQIVALLAEHDTNAEQGPENPELLTIAYMSGQSDEAARNRKTKQALRALLHYIDHAGTWPSDDWNMDRVREGAKGN